MDNPQESAAWVAPEFVSETSEKTPDGRKLSLYLCVCGQRFLSSAGRVKSGKRKTCGCKTGLIAPASKHGGRYSPEYKSWRAMKTRCLNANSKDYPRWGGRGVTIYPDWRDSFESFLSHMGQKPDASMSIDRIDPNGNYVPGNVRWASAQTQARNRVDLVSVANIYGIFPLVEWAEAVGISKGAAHLRLKRKKLEGCIRVS